MNKKTIATVYASPHLSVLARNKKCVTNAERAITLLMAL